MRALFLLRKENLDTTEEGNSLASRNKYGGVDILKNIGFNFKIGVMCSLAVVLLSFSWTTYDEVSYFEIPDIDDTELLVIPRTLPFTPPPPPPPPPPVIEPIPDEEVIEEDIPDFVDQDIEDDEVIEEPGPIAEEKDVAPIPIPAPVIEEPIDEIVFIPDSMPRFPGCEDISGTKKEKRACADKKMLEYIYSKLDYPQMAQSNGIEGTVVLQFVIDKEGKVKDINVVRKVGAGCDEAAAKVISDMNELPQRWTPGKQRGRNVKVMYTLPIKFKLLK